MSPCWIAQKSKAAQHKISSVWRSGFITLVRQTSKRRPVGSDGVVSVRCNTADGTATAGSDYTATTDTLNWSDGDTADKACTIPIFDDLDVEADESVALSLTHFTGGATPGVPFSATLYIQDNDGEG